MAIRTRFFLQTRPNYCYTTAGCFFKDTIADINHFQLNLAEGVGDGSGRGGRAYTVLVRSGARGVKVT